LPKLAWPTTLYVLYASAVYWFCKDLNICFSTEGLPLVAGCVTYMLVFRLNQCHSRLHGAQAMVAKAVGGLRGIVSCICTMARYTENNSVELTEDEQQAATLLKVHVCRLSIAYIVSLKYHMRAADMMNAGHKVDSDSLRHALTDLVRIKSLLTGVETDLLEYCCGLYEEGEEAATMTNTSSSFAVDMNRHRTQRDLAGLSLLLGGTGQAEHGGYAVPPFILTLLRMAIREPLDKRWGCPERVLSLCEDYIDDVIQAFRGMNRMVACPLPLPYLQLCKLLLCLFVLSLPWVVEPAHGAWSNIVAPSVLAMTFLGYETCSDIMENPLGDDSADISVYEAAHELEVDIQQIFDGTAFRRASILRSFGELGAQQGLRGGSSKFSPPEACKDTARFSDFFEWVRLPRHSVEYITMQSTDINALNWRLFCHGRAMPEDEHSESDVTDEENTLLRDATLKDMYTVRYCVALRASLPHLEEAACQWKALERAGLPGEISLQEAMASGRTRACSPKGSARRSNFW